MSDAVECVWDARAALGEGPVWCADESALYWVDIKGPRVLRYAPADGGRSEFAMPEDVGCLVPRRGGGFVAGLRSGPTLVDLGVAADRAFERIVEPEPDLPHNRINDGKSDSRGRLWFGTMDDACRRPTGSLYRLDPDRTLTRVDSGYVVTNGPAWSPDGTTLYHNDTLAGVVCAFDCDPESGELSNKRVFAEIEGGYPDGLTVDFDGCLWCAVWGGSRVTCFDPDGSVRRQIAMPATQVTSCTFGGPDLRTLYVTTAALGLSDAERAAQPLAGGLFALEVDVTGLPTHAFAG